MECVWYDQDYGSVSDEPIAIDHTELFLGKTKIKTEWEDEVGDSYVCLSHKATSNVGL